jgi:quercetin dioxygenase-like cupin family protein
MSLETTIIHSGDAPLFNVFGPLQQFLVAPSETTGAFGIMRALIPPSIAIPLHSHADPEVFFVLEGFLDVFSWNGEVSQWLTAQMGDVICVPGGIRHAIRNNSTVPTVILLATTPNIFESFESSGDHTIPASRPVRQPKRTCGAYWGWPRNINTGSALRSRTRLSV